MSTTFGSVCSGIEAASVAWRPLGWRAAWLAEIEPFPSAVLAHHYPDVSNLGDMIKLPERIARNEVDAPDVFCGGTPCQAFSVAGLRKSLDDARGNLSLSFCEIANAIDTARSIRGERPCIVFWENVPGVLNTKDNAFGCFLAGLAGEDDPLQPPGGRWANAGVVLGPKRAVAWRILDAQYFGVAQRRRRVFVVASARDGFDPAAALFEFGGVRLDSPPSRKARQGTSSATADGAPSRGSSVIWSPEVSSCMTSGGDAHRGFRDEGGLVLMDEGGSRMHASHELCGTLRGETHGHEPIALDIQNITSPANRTTAVSGNPCTTLTAGANTVVVARSGVRRITPVECERLQGFPDGYTAVPFRGKPASDRKRHKALGNSWAVPVVAWLGRRIAVQLGTVA